MASLLMAVYFQSLQGRLCALWLLAACSGLVLLTFTSIFTQRRKSIFFVTLGTGIALLAWRSPMFKPFSGSVGSSTPGWDWARYTPVTLIPESDWTELGLNILYPKERSQRLLPQMRQLYQEMEGTPGYGALSPTLPYTASDLFSLQTGLGHFYYFGAPGPQKRPLLVYLHGAMGNFECYLYHWQKWAQERNWNVICPTYGYGSWFSGPGGENAENCLRRAIQELPVDSDRVVVVGLSNGATGTVRLVQRCPDLIQRVMLVSPVLEPDQFCSSEFRNWADHHVNSTNSHILVLEGSDDINVRPETVERRLAAMQEQGLAPFPYQKIPGHDHHMMFTARPEIYQALDRLVRNL